MGSLVNYVTKLHLATRRAYIDRMIDDKGDVIYVGKAKNLKKRVSLFNYRLL